MLVHRPVWRRFIPRFFSRAADWVRQGGHAAVQHTDRHIDMILGADAAGKITEAGYWSILSLEQIRYVRIKEGAAVGLYKARVGKHALEAVLDWCDRDSMHPDATRPLELDCLACGACCVDSNVLLDEHDFIRFRAAGRHDLTKSPYVTRSKDGKVRLKFLKGGRCQHLAQDNKCHIYAIRPFNCSVFPVGSEACLAARESTLNLRDDSGHDLRHEDQHP